MNDTELTTYPNPPKPPGTLLRNFAYFTSVMTFHPGSAAPYFSLTRWLIQAMIGLGGSYIPSLFAQESRTYLYGCSEFQLLRFHRGFIPPALAGAAVGGIYWEAFRSGTTYRGILWGEARIGYVRGAVVNPFFPGVAGGLALRLGLPDPSRHYAQVNLGLDAYAFKVADGGGTFLKDSQLRPILSFEIGSFAFAEPVFLRYSMYPTPGTTSKYALAIGAYFGEL